MVELSNVATGSNLLRKQLTTQANELKEFASKLDFSRKQTDLLNQKLFGLEKVQKDLLGEKEALNDKTEKQVLVDKAIPDKQTAISVAAPILFKIYGKHQVVGEKPYNAHLIDGYWLISGTLPAALPDEDVVGGTFLIIFSSKDGRVIKLMHGK